MQPLENQDTIIFKLPIGYITSANLFIDLVNIDNTNNLFEFETNDNTKYSFRIQSKMYSTIEEVGRQQHHEISPENQPPIWVISARETKLQL